MHFVKFFQQTSDTAGASTQALETLANQWLTANGAQIKNLTSATFTVADHVNNPANGGILYFVCSLAYEADKLIP